uniref:N-acetyltransferase domain-containing protein n=1 Tax=Corethrella appendiculata TaxID=1370023 RepID=U5EV53_9DIPT
MILQRPENIPYPSEWLHFKARDVNNDNLVDYVIKDVPEEHFKKAIEHMVLYFINDEPINVCLNMANDRLGIENFKTMWEHFLTKKCVLACYKVGSEEIVGLNFVGIEMQSPEKAKNFKSKNFDKLVKTMIYCSKQFDMYKNYGIDRYLTACGLSVHPNYRGRGIGEQILRARVPMCKALGVKATSTVFTGAASQRSAEKCGFEVKFEETYENLAKLGEDYSFPGVKEKIIKTMCMKIE